MGNTATLKPAKPHRPARRAASFAPKPAHAFAMLSHRGRVRQANQDACAALPELGAFVVCDGIGGAAAGDVASRLASQAFLDTLNSQTSSPAQPRPARRIPPQSEPARSIGGSAELSSRVRLEQAVRMANQAVYRHSRTTQSLHGMGTTLVAALWDESDHSTLWLAHVGDSRAYLFRRGALQLLTQDHSLVEEQIRAGTLSRVQAAASPIRNIITRAIGPQPVVEAEIAAHTTQPGDLYMLASDGLTRELSEAEIARTLVHALARPAHDPLEAACQALVDAANQRGGHDNITVLLVTCP